MSIFIFSIQSSYFFCIKMISIISTFCFIVKSIPQFQPILLVQVEKWWVNTTIFMLIKGSIHPGSEKFCKIGLRKHLEHMYSSFSIEVVTKTPKLSFILIWTKKDNFLLEEINLDKYISSGFFDLNFRPVWVSRFWTSYFCCLSTKTLPKPASFLIMFNMIHFWFIRFFFEFSFIRCLGLTKEKCPIPYACFKKNKTACVTSKPWMPRLSFKVYGAVIT